MKKICLVVANSEWFGMRRWSHVMPSVPIITSILKPLFDFSVLDANGYRLTEIETLAKLRETEADIILITALSTEYYKQYHKVAELAKKALAECTVVMGGAYTLRLCRMML